MGGSVTSVLRLLDTDVLIDIQRGHPPAIVWFTSLIVAPSVPGFVVMELTQNARDKQQQRQTDRLISGLPIVWPTMSDCQHALDTFHSLHLSHSLGLLDSLIAATALGLGANLCTFNIKHYRAIPNLVTEQPYQR